ncbi:pyridoxamine 5'-phosphate oxidase family protein [Faecalispora anaeroviscerum]|uniref:pyridoxamine 5'-phosphate oxidase family protein n=1 Tax=Faecalispora anaeroviscerum TaxID=2991836 RepID=UPI0024B998DA|nr:pyridoxamine 5'-phosphate oxidase family protein [Faecalispora anaeroviscerum]
MNYDEAAAYWDERETETIRMEPTELLEAIEKFIVEHNTCALATGCGAFVRCTPIEYCYKDKNFWILSEGGLKFHALKGNQNVSLAIFDSFTGFNHLGGLQVTGTAEVIEPWSAEYMNWLTYKKISSEKLKKLPSTLYLIKIIPTRMDFLCSEFKQLGFDYRQHIIL